MSAGHKYLDAGASIGGRFGSIIPQFTAGAAGDNTKVTGQWIDRLDFDSGAVLAGFQATLAQGATLSLAVEREESDDGANANAGSAQVVQASKVAATGPTGGGTVRGVLKVRDNFETAARYVRYNVTPDLSAAGVDTASVSTLVALGGAHSLPVP